ncbi:5028_t:CDS:2 [Rhizophagus irregularis]|nr:5028_t:CDS:2 [Rhizophagus irregularis]
MRFVDHGLDCNRYRFGKVTNSNQLRNNKFSNIAGVCDLTILFENSASGLNNIRINGSTTTPPGNGKKVEKKIHNVLVLKESDVEFRLGNDFISDTNAVIEPKPRSNYNNRKYTHQLRFKDGVIVDLEKVDNLHDFDEEEENTHSLVEELVIPPLKYTESLDNTKRTLLDMYNQEVTYAFIFQQNVENLAKYLSLKKRRNILRMIPLIGVMDEMNTLQVYCERIIKQVEKLKDELKSFIVNGKSLTAWLKTLITKFTKKVDNLGEIDSETALKCQKLFIALDNDLRELLDLFKDLRINITSHLSSLFEFSEHFKFTERLTDLEINIIKKHLVNLQNNRRIIFSEVINILKDDKDEDICPAPSPIFPLVLPSNSQLALQNL